MTSGAAGNRHRQTGGPSGRSNRPAPGTDARTLMLQGTGSDVGKSLITAGLARALTNRGFKVRPFKPQNMSNNAAVTDDGGEIGRAQALQARAAKTAPTTDMNPVLLKPQSQLGAQIIVQGKVYGTAKAAAYQQIKRQLMAPILESFARLKSQADFVLVEGAGSASEVNLRANDIANMGFARAANVPVVLIGDIDRGGVIASLVGTHHVIDPDDAAMIRGFIVNRFRGDPALFDGGMATIAAATGWDNLGLLPHFDGASKLPAEDAFALSRAKPGALSGEGAGDENNTAARKQSKQRRIKIAVPVLPHIANFDDLDPLQAEPDVELVLVRAGSAGALPGDADLIILCGSKSTIADLAALRAAGFDIDIAAHKRRGGCVLGICGGLQILGRSLADPDGIEGAPTVAEGLGLLDIETTLCDAKRLAAVRGETIAAPALAVLHGAPLNGYLMHMGETTGPGLARPFAQIESGASDTEQTDGAVSADGKIFGSYVHGLFGNDAGRGKWLEMLGGSDCGGSSLAYEASIDQTLDDLAAHLERHLDIDALIALMR